MSVVRHLFWKNPLTPKVRRPGGVQAARAIAAAEENLKTLGDDCARAIEDGLAEIEALSLQCRGGAEAAVVERVYRLSNRLIGLGAVAGRPQIDRAAFSLCEVIDLMRCAGGWEDAAVGVHLRAMRLLCEQPRSTGEEASEAMMLGLDKVAAKWRRLAPGGCGKAAPVQ